MGQFDRLPIQRLPLMVHWWHFLWPTWLLPCLPAVACYCECHHCYDWHPIGEGRRWCMMMCRDIPLATSVWFCCELSCPHDPGCRTSVVGCDISHHMLDTLSHTCNGDQKWDNIAYALQLCKCTVCVYVLWCVHARACVQCILSSACMHMWYVHVQRMRAHVQYVCWCVKHW